MANQHKQDSDATRARLEKAIRVQAKAETMLREVSAIAYARQNGPTRDEMTLIERLRIACKRAEVNRGIMEHAS